MNAMVKWLLVAVVVVAVLAVIGTPTADAARWRVYSYGYPAYYGPAPYVYSGRYYYGPTYVAPPVVAYPGPVVVAPVAPRAVYRPILVPRPVRYWGW